MFKFFCLLKKVGKLKKKLDPTLKNVELFTAPSSPTIDFLHNMNIE